MRVHKINNVNKALDFIASKGVKLVSIGAEGEAGTPGVCCGVGHSRSRTLPGGQRGQWGLGCLAQSMSSR